MTGRGEEGTHIPPYGRVTQPSNPALPGSRFVSLQGRVTGRGEEEMVEETHIPPYGEPLLGASGLGGPSTVVG